MLGAESYLGRQNCQVGSFDGKLPALVSHLNVAGLAFLPREERGGAAWQPGSLAAAPARNWDKLLN